MIGIPLVSLPVHSLPWLGVPGWTEAAAEPVPPAAPADLTATPGNGEITLAWAGVEGATSYSLWRRTSPGVTVLTGTELPDVTSPHADTGRVNGTPYYYVVTAENAGGQSEPSAEVSATPAAAIRAVTDWVT